MPLVPLKPPSADPTANVPPPEGSLPPGYAPLPTASRLVPLAPPDPPRAVARPYAEGYGIGSAPPSGFVPSMANLAAQGFYGAGADMAHGAKVATGVETFGAPEAWAHQREARNAVDPVLQAEVDQPVFTGEGFGIHWNPDQTLRGTAGKVATGIGSTAALLGGTVGLAAPAALLGAPLGAALVAGGAGANFLAQGGSAAQRAEDAVAALPDEVLAKSPQYMAAKAQNTPLPALRPDGTPLPATPVAGSPEYAAEQAKIGSQTRATLVRQAGRDAFLPAAVPGAVSGAVGTALMGPLLKGFGGGLLPAVAKGAAVEFPQEFADSATERFAENVALRPYDNRPLSQGVLAEGLSGGAVGALQGGLASAPAGLRTSLVARAEAKAAAQQPQGALPNDDPAETPPAVDPGRLGGSPVEGPGTPEGNLAAGLASKGAKPLGGTGAGAQAGPAPQPADGNPEAAGQPGVATAQAATRVAGFVFPGPDPQAPGRAAGRPGRAGQVPGAAAGGPVDRVAAGLGGAAGPASTGLQRGMGAPTAAPPPVDMAAEPPGTPPVDVAQGPAATGAGAAGVAGSRAYPFKLAPHLMAPEAQLEGLVLDQAPPVEAQTISTPPVKETANGQETANAPDATGQEATPGQEGLLDQEAGATAPAAHPTFGKVTNNPLGSSYPHAVEPAGPQDLTEGEARRVLGRLHGTSAYGGVFYGAYHPEADGRMDSGTAQRLGSLRELAWLNGFSLGDDSQLVLDPQTALYSLPVDRVGNFGVWDWAKAPIAMPAALPERTTTWLDEDHKQGLVHLYRQYRQAAGGAADSIGKIEAAGKLGNDKRLADLRAQRDDAMEQLDALVAEHPTIPAEAAALAKKPGKASKGGSLLAPSARDRTTVNADIRARIDAMAPDERAAFAQSQARRAERFAHDEGLAALIRAEAEYAANPPAMEASAAPSERTQSIAKEMLDRFSRRFGVESPGLLVDHDDTRLRASRVTEGNNLLFDSFDGAQPYKPVLHATPLVGHLLKKYGFETYVSKDADGAKSDLPNRVLTFKPSEQGERAYLGEAVDALFQLYKGTPAYAEKAGDKKNLRVSEAQRSAFHRSFIATLNDPSRSGAGLPPPELAAHRLALGDDSLLASPPAEGTEAVDLSKAMRQDRLAALMIKRLSDGGFAVTGSAALAPQGAGIYRKGTNLLHDIDVAAPQGTPVDERAVTAMLRKAMPYIGETKPFREILRKQGSNTFSYFIPKPGYTVRMVEEKPGKTEFDTLRAYAVYDRDMRMVEYIVHQAKGGGGYYTPEGRRIREEESHTRVLDIFVEPSRTPIAKVSVDHPSHGPFDANLSGFVDAFKAKIGYDRAKDLADYNRFRPYAEDRGSEGERLYDKGGKPLARAAYGRKEKSLIIGSRFESLMRKALDGDGPSLHALVAYEVTAHEFGHYLDREFLTKESQEVQDAVQADYEAWHAKAKKSGKAGAAKSRLTPGRASVMEDRSFDGDAVATNSVKWEYLLSREEWIADNVARYLTKHDLHAGAGDGAGLSEEAKGFFVRAAQWMRAIWNKMFSHLDVAPSITEWLRGMEARAQGVQPPGPAAVAPDVGGALAPKPKKPRKSLKRKDNAPTPLESPVQVPVPALQPPEVEAQAPGAGGPGEARPGTGAEGAAAAEGLAAVKGVDWDRRHPNGYEVSRRGDKDYSAFYAKLPDGRTIEKAYQDAKGSGKGQPAKDPGFDYWGTYLGFWRQWAAANPDKLEALRGKARGKVLTDQFASTENNQARALATVLKETASGVRPPAAEPAGSKPAESKAEALKRKAEARKSAAQLSARPEPGYPGITADVAPEVLVGPRFTRRTDEDDAEIERLTSSLALDREAAEAEDPGDDAEAQGAGDDGYQLRKDGERSRWLSPYGQKGLDELPDSYQMRPQERGKAERLLVLWSAGRKGSPDQVAEGKDGAYYLLPPPGEPGAKAAPLKRNPGTAWRWTVEPREGYAKRVAGDDAPGQVPLVAQRWERKDGQWTRVDDATERGDRLELVELGNGRTAFRRVEPGKLASATGRLSRAELDARVQRLVGQNNSEAKRGEPTKLLFVKPREKGQAKEPTVRSTEAMNYNYREPKEYLVALPQLAKEFGPLLDAIAAGKRTSTIRRFATAEGKKWEKLRLKTDDIVAFKGKDGRTLQVYIRSVEKLDPATADWEAISKTEGWTADSLRAYVKGKPFLYVRYGLKPHVAPDQVATLVDLPEVRKLGAAALDQHEPAGTSSALQNREHFLAGLGILMSDYGIRPLDAADGKLGIPDDAVIVPAPEGGKPVTWRELKDISKGARDADAIASEKLGDGREYAERSSDVARGKAEGILNRLGLPKNTGHDMAPVEVVGRSNEPNPSPWKPLKKDAKPQEARGEPEYDERGNELARLKEQLLVYKRLLKGYVERGEEGEADSIREEMKTVEAQLKDYDAQGRVFQEGEVEGFDRKSKLDVGRDEGESLPSHLESSPAIARLAAERRLADVERRIADTQAELDGVKGSKSQWKRDELSTRLQNLDTELKQARKNIDVLDKASAVREPRAGNTVPDTALGKLAEAFREHVLAAPGQVEVHQDLGKLDAAVKREVASAKGDAAKAQAEAMAAAVDAAVAGKEQAFIAAFPGKHIVYVDPSLAQTRQAQALFHEMGHFMADTALANLVKETAGRFARYRDLRKEGRKGEAQRMLRDPEFPLRERMELIQDLFGRHLARAMLEGGADLRLASYPEWLQANERFARAMERWAIKDKEAVGFADQFFKGLGQRLGRLWDSIRKALGLAEKNLDKNFDEFMKAWRYRRGVAPAPKTELGKRYVRALDGMALTGKDADPQLRNWSGMDALRKSAKVNELKRQSKAAVNWLHKLVAPALYSVVAQMRMHGAEGEWIAQHWIPEPGYAAPVYTARDGTKRTPGYFYNNVLTEGGPWLNRLSKLLDGSPRLRKGLLGLKRDEEGHLRHNAISQALIKHVPPEKVAKELKAAGTPEQWVEHDARLVADVRKYLNDLHKTLTRSRLTNDEGNPVATHGGQPGYNLDIGSIKDYFPLVVDQEKWARDYDKVIDIIREHIEDTHPDADGLSAQEQAENIYHMISQNDGVLFSWGERMAQGAEIDRIYGPSFRYGLSRTMSDALRAKLASYYLADVGGLLKNYTHQGIKRGVASRMWGGTNAQGKWDYMYEINIRLVEATRPQAGQRPSMTRQEMDRFVRKYLPALMGVLGNDTITPQWRQLQSVLTTSMNIGLLPLAVLSSFAELGQIDVRRGAYSLQDAMTGRTWGAQREALRMMLTSKGREERAKLLEEAKHLGSVHVDLIEHAMASNLNATYYMPTTGKVSEAFFKLNGMKMWTDFTRVVALSMAKQSLARYLATNDTKQLAELGLAGKEAMLKQWLDAGSPVHTADLAIRKALNAWIDSAVLRPNAAMRPAWGSDPNMAIFWYLKDFMWGFWQTIAKRVWAQAQEQPHVMKVLPFMMLPALLIPLAILGWEVRKWLTGEAVSGLTGEPVQRREMDAGEYWWQAFKRSGSLGPFELIGDLVNAGEHGESVLLAVSGPVLDKLQEFFLHDQDLVSSLEHTLPLLAQSATLRAWVNHSLGLEGQ